MKKRILITDTLFIAKSHEALLRDAGFDLVRLDNPSLTEDQLCKAIKGIHGYILGGVERVTPRVLEAATNLEAICFTGAGFKEFIPGFESATKRGIAIANAPGGNASAVAEFTVALIMMMTRRLLALGRTGSQKFHTANSLLDSSVGIVGLGNVGMLVALYLRGLGVQSISYFTRRRRYELEAALGITYSPLEELVSGCDVISIHVSKDAGAGYIGAAEIDMMKDNSLVVNAAYPEAVNFKVLSQQLRAGRIYAAFDGPPSDDYGDLPMDRFFCSNAQTAFNTATAVNTVSDMATRSLINLMHGGDDLFLVNPEFRKFRKSRR